ncbi:hypothetical protein PR202_gb27599 [Eleusine coracana subsp. coracana]|uniref:RING-type domain-containing protein n=1 Tax=Eleusine coracana subsp. coracana TaxID=191504 RepID=A0AAV5FVR5_ELECO|nr:hypothetical protein QOZ80_6AG0541860 [Eleusine coracana subsp. coracana]GJN38545.1 hypothetical protein PR202_gb27599 [Eleusine coracana subsp. coracana]
MLNVHRPRLLAAGSRASSSAAEEESRVLCAVVASVMSLMLLCGLLSVVPSPRAFGVTKTYVVVGLGAAMLLLLLAGWLVAPWFRAAPTASPAAPLPPVRLLALRQMCACGIGDAAVLGALPAFAYEPEMEMEATAGSPAARGSCALCAVCLEDVRPGEMVRKLPACGHLFHVCCVDAWLRSHPTCPICRRELPPRGAVVAKASAVVSSTQATHALPPV